jgi:chemotaxis protein methyltransferase CheR
VLKLLEKILTKEQGFEVVATATNGLEAAEKLKLHKVDVMTLDIHMPEQNGIEYLQRNYGSDHPPVVMVTSVSREDAALGLKALELGAKDYVEKPSLSNLDQRGEEIRTKLRCAWQLAKGVDRGVSKLERSFEKAVTIQNPDKKFRGIVASLGDRDRLVKLLTEFRGPQPPTVLFFDGADSLLSSVCGQFRTGIWSPQLLSSAFEPLKAGQLYIADFSRLFAEMKKQHGSRKTSLLVLSDPGSRNADEILSWNRAHLVLEDLGGSLSPSQTKLKQRAKDFVPLTSFAYLSDDFLSKDT